MLCLCSFTIVTSSRVLSNVLSEKQRRWLEAGYTDLSAGNSVWKITQFDCYSLNDRGKMEIDNVFASGTVVGRASSHSWGRPAPRCARNDGRPHSCVVARPTTAPDAKTLSIPTTVVRPHVFGSAITKARFKYLKEVSCGFQNFWGIKQTVEHTRITSKIDISICGGQIN